MKVLVAGGREFNNPEWLYEVLHVINDTDGITEIIQGGARGADTYAETWALINGVKNTRVDANWNLHGKRAGWVRNNEMADLRPDLVVLFPGGRGTQMMYDIAIDRGLNVSDLREDDDER